MNGGYIHYWWHSIYFAPLCYSDITILRQMTMTTTLKMLAVAAPSKWISEALGSRDLILHDHLTEKRRLSQSMRVSHTNTLARYGTKDRSRGRTGDRRDIMIPY